MAGDEFVSGLTSTPLEEFLELGRTVEYLLRTIHPNVSASNESFLHLASNHPQHIYTLAKVRTAVQALTERLEEHSFANSLAAAAPTREITDLIDRHLEQRPQDRHERMKEEWANRLIGYVRSLNSTLKAEATARQMVQLDLSAVTEAIAGLPERFHHTSLEMQDWQRALWQDTLRCLQTRAYRPAIIVGWALSFDILRYWVFRDSTRLSDFNTELQSRQGKQIVAYEDFFALNEATVLDYCRLAGGTLAGFTAKLQRALQVLLDERNEYAHANYRQATASIAQAHIEKLVGILSGPPFLSA